MRSATISYNAVYDIDELILLLTTIVCVCLCVCVFVCVCACVCPIIRSINKCVKRKFTIV